jgi:hypothetical protein
MSFYDVMDIFYVGCERGKVQHLNHWNVSTKFTWRPEILREKLLHYEINCETVSDLYIYFLLSNDTFNEPVMNWSILNLHNKIIS